jgi:AcrR family transcriptional regulator
MGSKAAANQRRTPKQARSRAACEAIVEAAAQILEQGGADALTTNAVAERAGVSIGTLYQYFPDKQAILVAAARREFEPLPLARRPAALVAALIAALERFAGLAGAATASPKRPAAPRPKRATAWDQRIAELAAEWLAILAAPPLALRPIPIRRQRRPPSY